LAELHAPWFDSNEGGSCIIDPGGQAIVQAHGGEEEIITATASLESTTRGLLWNDVVGQYSRPDIFQLIVNRRPLRAATFVDDPAMMSETTISGFRDKLEGIERYTDDMSPATHE
jgi:hypothetical protein